MFHASPYYWINKNKSMPFFGGVPGGVTAQNIMHGLIMQEVKNYGMKCMLSLDLNHSWRKLRNANGRMVSKEINSVEDFKA